MIKLFIIAIMFCLCISIVSAVLSLDSPEFYTLGDDSNLMILTPFNEPSSTFVTIPSQGGGGGGSPINVEEPIILSLPPKSMTCLNDNSCISTTFFFSFIGIVVLVGIFLFIFFKRRKKEDKNEN